MAENPSPELGVEPVAQLDGEQGVEAQRAERLVVVDPRRGEPDHLGDEVPHVGRDQIGAVGGIGDGERLDQPG